MLTKQDLIDAFKVMDSNVIGYSSPKEMFMAFINAIPDKQDCVGDAEYESWKRNLEIKTKDAKDKLIEALYPKWKQKFVDRFGNSHFIFPEGCNPIDYRGSKGMKYHADIMSFIETLLADELKKLGEDIRKGCHVNQCDESSIASAVIDKCLKKRGIT